jgi:hypothetical protein
MEDVFFFFFGRYGFIYTVQLTVLEVALSGLVVSVLAIVPKVRGFKPGQGQWIFKGDDRNL